MMIWLNGALIRQTETRIAPDDRGFLLGDGLFETLAVHDGAPLRLPAHLARLARGAQVLDIPLPEVDWAGAMTAVLKANGLERGSLRLTVTRGSGSRGVLPPPSPHPTVMITAAPPPPSPPGPVHLIVAESTRRNEHSPLSGIKSLNYLDAILARQEATRRGADEAILLNTQGRLSETTISTLFLVLGDRILTPSLEEGALPGVARAEILSAGLAEEAPLPLETLENARAILLTNSLNLRWVRTLGTTPLSEPIEIMEEFQKILRA